jgi:hypothetical protein
MDEVLVARGVLQCVVIGVIVSIRWLLEMGLQ